MTEEGPTLYQKIIRLFVLYADGPVTFYKEKIAIPNQQKYPWYHKQFRRVPTIETCRERDIACITEADYQFLRDKNVDEAILKILRGRYEDCVWQNTYDREICVPLRKTYEDNCTNYFIKYGDLGIASNVRGAFMKQKHRMIWERRHGPVGSGMKEKYVPIE